MLGLACAYLRNDKNWLEKANLRKISCVVEMKKLKSRKKSRDHMSACNRFSVVKRNKRHGKSNAKSAREKPSFFSWTLMGIQSVGGGPTQHNLWGWPRVIQMYVEPHILGHLISLRASILLCAMLIAWCWQGMKKKIWSRHLDFLSDQRCSVPRVKCMTCLLHEHVVWFRWKSSWSLKIAAINFRYSNIVLLFKPLIFGPLAKSQ